MSISPEFKERWTAELRGGRYTQSPGYLRTVDDRYCCLGVAADLVDPGEWLSVPGASYDWNGSDVDLPDDVLVYLGLTVRDMNTLMVMNDEGQTFGEIANWIDRHL